MSLRKYLGLASVLPALVAPVGCGEPRQESVSGRVTLDGQPLADGTIEFDPESGTGLALGGLIEEGRYALPNPPGLPPGRYSIRIRSRGGAAALPRKPDMDLTNPGAREQIPSRYNDATELHAGVAPGASNRFDFELSRRDAARGASNKTTPIR